MNEWIAFKKNGEKLYSKEISYSDLPMEEIVGFSVVTRKSSMYVNLLNGKLAKNGKLMTTKQIDNLLPKHVTNNTKLKLLFSKRAYVEFNIYTGDSSNEKLEYIVCGWETHTLKVYLQLNFLDDNQETIDIEIKEKM